jgi:hypothetical protein
VRFLGEPIGWVETARYLGVTLGTQLTWSAHINQVGKKAAQRLGVLGPLLNRRSGLSVRNGVLLISSSSVLCWITHVRSGGPLPAATSGSCKCYNPSVFALRLTHLGTLVTGTFTRNWGFHSSPTTSELWLKVSNYAGNPLVRQLGRHLCRPRADWSHTRVTEVDWCSAGQPRLSL